jgi:23S rRNA (uracil1939-C5)-methyltransferase
VVPGAQPALKGDVVVDALRRLGGLADPSVTPGPSLPAHGYRTTVRAAVVGGRAGFRRAGTHDVVVAGCCAVAHPLVAEVLAEGHFGAATEVTVRAGVATGERLVVVDPVADGVRVPDDVVVVGRDELRRGRRAWIHEEVAGRRWRISATSFFQIRPDGAGALVEAVLAAASPLPEGPATVVDAYSGVGLLAGALAGSRAGPGSGRRHVVAVERGRSAVADARHNLADLDVEVVRAPVERARLPVADLVVADPARSGLGAAGVRALARCGAPRIVLVSCDPASLGRDTALLATVGYRHAGTTLVDLFPQTHHLEAVSLFLRA